MEIANVRVRLDKLGSDVPIKGVTPAEALVLHIIHQQNNGGSTFGEAMDKIEILGEAEDVNTYTEPVRGPRGAIVTPETVTYKPRTDTSELKRLQRRYGSLTNKKGDKILNLIFPDKLNPKLPQSFSDLKWSEIQFDGLEVSATDYAAAGAALPR